LSGYHPALKHPDGRFAQLNIHLIPVRKAQRGHLNDPAADDRHTNLDGAVVGARHRPGGNS